MAEKVIMPQMGESVVEGTVARWLVREGERVGRDQPLVAVSTDKVDVEIPSPAEGILSRILVPEGQTVDVGAALAVIDGEGETSPPPAPEKAEGKPAPAPRPTPVTPGERRRISPLVRRLAKEHGVDLSQVAGTGLEGRITKEDLLRHLGEATGPLRPQPSERKGPIPPGETPPSTEVAGGYRIPPYTPKPGDRLIPFTRVRKRIADHMVASKRISAHVSTVAEVDLTALVRLRAERKQQLKEKEGVDLTFLHFVIAAAVGALKEYPLLNASVAEDQIIVKKEINIGIAVDTEAGLIVPVLHQADTLSLIGLARAAGALAERARSSQLSPQEISGGTFTISNPGKKGNLFGTPILVQPQVGILRMGEVTKRPVVIEVGGEDALAIRSMMYLTLSYDHRIIDGVTGNGFLHRVKTLLEEGDLGL